jgi:hypothetical protein
VVVQVPVTLLIHLALELAGHQAVVVAAAHLMAVVVELVQAAKAIMVAALLVPIQLVAAAVRVQQELVQVELASCHQSLVQP